MGDLTVFEALTGGAFDRQNGNIAGNLTKIFQKSQMPLARGGWAVLELTSTLHDTGATFAPGRVHSGYLS